MGAIWKVRTRLKNALGTAAGGDVADLLFNAWMNAYDDTQIRTIIEDHWLTLDDDNGNVGDGTPHYPHIDGGFRDQGFPGVDLALVSYLSVTDLPNTESEAGPYTVNASIVANFNPPLRAVELRYRVDGGAFQTVAMASSGGSGYTADIPGQESPARVEYYLTAADDSGNVATFPGNAPSALLKFVVGREVVYYAETFESGTNGWTHRSNNGAQDDWQLSSQVGAGSGTFGKSGDPTRAFSGTNVWGNDLGPSGWNGAYQDDVDNSLVSPAIDLSRATNTILRFRRWVTVEAGIYDQTRALVNGVEVWRNPDGADLLDTSWQEVEVDISAIADGDSAARVEFNLRSDQSVVFGGWNVDDVEILTFAASSEPAPAAAFGADRTSGVAPLTVSFSDLSSGAVSSWSWSFGDGGRSSAQSPSHQYAVPGTYTVALTVTGPGGSDTETAVDLITVATPPPVAGFGADRTSGVAPLTVSFSDLSSGAVSSWSWSFGDGGRSSAQSPSHLYTVPGTYTVALTVTGPGGSDTETAVDLITVATPPPVAGFGADRTSGVAPLTVSFSDLSSGAVSSWSWSFGDGGRSSAQSPSHQYTVPGTYTVALTVTGPGGSDTETAVDLITVATPPPVAGFGADRTSGVAPLTVSFSDLSSGAVSSWSWSFGDGGRSSAQSPSHQYAVPGTYTVALTVTGPGGSDTETAVDLITVATPPPVAGFGADRTSGRAPLSVQFTDTSSGAVTAWAWELGDGTRSTSANPSHVYTSSGAYTVRLTVTGPGGSDSETQTNLIVVAPPLVISGVTPSEIDLLIPGDGGDRLGHGHELHAEHRRRGRRSSGRCGLLHGRTRRADHARHATGRARHADAHRPRRGRFGRRGRHGRPAGDAEATGRQRRSAQRPELGDGREPGGGRKTGHGPLRAVLDEQRTQHGRHRLARDRQLLLRALHRHRREHSRLGHRATRRSARRPHPDRRVRAERRLRARQTPAGQQPAIRALRALTEGRRTVAARAKSAQRRDESRTASSAFKRGGGLVR